MRNVLFLFLIILIAGCKNDPKSGSQADNLIKPDNSAAADPTTLTIPNACEMISESTLQTILNITGSSVNIKEANDPGNKSAKSCFFKWDSADTPNAGILVQILTNPVYSDYPQYISNYVSSKLTEGETVLGSDKATKFNKFTAGGVNGAYSFDQSRFYWNLGNNYLFMLAFNVSTLSEEKMVKVAEQIVVEVNKNFATKIKE
jgi:hypothetical protein